MKKSCERCGSIYNDRFRPRLTVHEGTKKIQLCRECTVVLTAWMGPRKKRKTCITCKNSMYDMQAEIYICEEPKAQKHGEWLTPAMVCELWEEAR